MGLVGALITLIMIFIIWKVSVFLWRYTAISGKVNSVVNLTDFHNAFTRKYIKFVQNDKVYPIFKQYHDSMDKFWKVDFIKETYDKWVEFEKTVWESDAGTKFIDKYHTFIIWFGKQIDESPPITNAEEWLERTKWRWVSALKLTDGSTGGGGEGGGSASEETCGKYKLYKEPADITAEDLLGGDEEGGIFEDLLAGISNPEFLKILGLAGAIQASPSIFKAVTRGVTKKIIAITTTTSTAVSVKILKNVGMNAIGGSIGKAALRGIAHHTFKTGLKSAGKLAASGARMFIPGPLMILELASITLDVVDPYDFNKLEETDNVISQVDQMIYTEFLAKGLQYPPIVGPIEKLHSILEYELELEKELANIVAEMGVLPSIMADADAMEFKNCDELDAYIEKRLDESLDMDAIASRAVTNVCLANDGKMVGEHCRFVDPVKGCADFMRISNAIVYSVTKKDCIVLMDAIKNDVCDNNYGLVFDQDGGRCKWSSQSCRAKGGDWNNGKCNVSDEQAIAELIFGTTVVRSFKTATSGNYSRPITNFKDALPTWGVNLDFIKRMSECRFWRPYCEYSTDGGCECTTECDPNAYVESDRPRKKMPMSYCRTVKYRYNNVKNFKDCRWGRNKGRRELYDCNCYETNDNSPTKCEYTTSGERYCYKIPTKVRRDGAVKDCDHNIAQRIDSRGTGGAKCFISYDGGYSDQETNLDMCYPKEPPAIYGGKHGEWTHVKYSRIYDFDDAPTHTRTTNSLTYAKQYASAHNYTGFMRRGGDYDGPAETVFVKSVPPGIDTSPDNGTEWSSYGKDPCIRGSHDIPGAQCSNVVSQADQQAIASAFTKVTGRPDYIHGIDKYNTFSGLSRLECALKCIESPYCGGFISNAGTCDVYPATLKAEHVSSEHTWGWDTHIRNQ